MSHSSTALKVVGHIPRQHKAHPKPSTIGSIAIHFIGSLQRSVSGTNGVAPRSGVPTAACHGYTKRRLLLFFFAFLQPAAPLLEAVAGHRDRILLVLFVCYLFSQMMSAFDSFGANPTSFTRFMARQPRNTDFFMGDQASPGFREVVFGAQKLGPCAWVQKKTQSTDFPLFLGGGFYVDLSQAG